MHKDTFIYALYSFLNTFRLFFSILQLALIFADPTMADDYVCTLDEKTLEKAKKELNEDPKNRLGAVQTLREWIQQQPHLHCKTGET